MLLKPPTCSKMKFSSMKYNHPEEKNIYKIIKCWSFSKIVLIIISILAARCDWHWYFRLWHRHCRRRRLHCRECHIWELCTWGVCYFNLSLFFHCDLYFHFFFLHKAQLVLVIAFFFVVWLDRARSKQLHSESQPRDVLCIIADFLDGRYAILFNILFGFNF